MPIRIRCPECNALMQVADSAAGKRTKCPKCTAIFPVPASLSGAAPKSPTGQTSGSAGSSGPAPPAAPASAPRAPQPNPAAPRGNIRQVRCPQCRQIMRAAAGSTVRCPKCQATVKVPAAGSAPSAAGGLPSNALDFDDLPAPTPGGGSFGSSYGSAGPSFSSTGPAPARSGGSWSAAGPYASSGGGYGRASGSLPSGREPWQYIIPGVCYALLGLLLLVGLLFRIVATVLLLVDGHENLDLPFILGQLVGAAIVSGALQIIYFMGAWAMIKRQGLTAARTAAVFAAIPCCNGIIFTPIGIWACVLVFSAKAQRDFHD